MANMATTSASLIPVDGPKIRIMRDRAGFSLRQFAREVRADPTHLSRIERGTGSPSPSLRNRIAERLGVTVDDIAKTPQAA